MDVSGYYTKNFNPTASDGTALGGVPGSHLAHREGELNCGGGAGPGPFPQPAEDKDAADCGIEFVEYNWKDHQDDSAKMPTTGADNGLQLIDMRGLDFDDEKWDTLLDQVTVDEMVNMLNDAAYNTAAIESVGKPETAEPDGPAGFTSLTGPTGNCAYCSEFIMAQTWNVDLMRQMGEMVGQEALASGYNGWYAPAFNTHRSPFAGRNFEYYSEDPLVSGKMAAALTRGVQSRYGVGTTIKHYACNNQEENRRGVSSIVSERALREIYLKGFEIAIKESQPMAIMTSYNKVNGVHTANSYDLCTTAARKEWGFAGIIMTDWTTTNADGGSSAAKCIAAGNDLVMPGTDSDRREILDALTAEHDQYLEEKDLTACAERMLEMIFSSNLYE